MTIYIYNLYGRMMIIFKILNKIIEKMNNLDLILPSVCIQKWM